MYLPCISSVFLPLYSVHSDVLYRCVSCMYRRCIVMYRSCAWCPRLCYYIDTCGGIDFLQYWTIQCRIQVSYIRLMTSEVLIVQARIEARKRKWQGNVRLGARCAHLTREPSENRGGGSVQCCDGSSSAVLRMSPSLSVARSGLIWSASSFFEDGLEVP